MPANPNTDHYPTSWVWTNGTTNGPSATIGMVDLGNQITNIAVAAIPSASVNTSGIITTSSQTISGQKNFTTGLTATTIEAGAEGVIDRTVAIQTHGTVKINNAELYYNSTTQSLDFMFA